MTWTILLGILALVALNEWRLWEKRKRTERSAEKALQATRQMCDASRDFALWMGRNSPEDISHSRSQELLGNLLHTYVRFLETHPTFNTSLDREHAHRMLALLIKKDEDIEKRLFVLKYQKEG